MADADVQQQKEGCRRLVGRLFRKGPYGTEEEENGGNVLALPATEIEAINIEVQTRKVRNGLLLLTIHDLEETGNI